MNIDRSTVRYTSVPPDDAHLREAMKKVAVERRRFRCPTDVCLQTLRGGYRHIQVMLERQGDQYKPEEAAAAVS